MRRLQHCNGWHSSAVASVRLADEMSPRWAVRVRARCTGVSNTPAGTPVRAWLATIDDQPVGSQFAAPVDHDAQTRTRDAPWLGAGMIVERANGRSILRALGPRPSWRRKNSGAETASPPTARCTSWRTRLGCGRAALSGHPGQVWTERALRERGAATRRSRSRCVDRPPASRQTTRASAWAAAHPEGVGGRVTPPGRDVLRLPQRARAARARAPGGRRAWGALRTHRAAGSPGQRHGRGRAAGRTDHSVSSVPGAGDEITRAHQRFMRPVPARTPARRNGSSIAKLALDFERKP